MNDKPQYDQQLRAIGQALEAQGISVFEMKSALGRYIVNGTPEKPVSLLGALRQLQKQGWKNGARMLNLGPADLAGIERQGRAQRRKPDSLPDFYNLSNTLRTVGAYLDSKKAELLGMQKQPLTVTLLYQSGNGHPRVEDRTIASFYDIFIGQYGRRSRPKTSARQPGD